MTGANCVGQFHLFCTNKQPDIFAATIQKYSNHGNRSKIAGGDAGSIVLPYQIS